MYRGTPSRRSSNYSYNRTGLLLGKRAVGVKIEKEKMEFEKVSENTQADIVKKFLFSIHWVRLTKT